MILQSSGAVLVPQLAVLQLPQLPLLPTWHLTMRCFEAAVRVAGVLGTLLADEEAGRAKLTRLAMSVGKVSFLLYDLHTTCLCTSI